MVNFKFNSKYERSIVGKAMEQKITDFSTNEIDRVYKNCVAPNVCKKVIRTLIERGLTIEHVLSIRFEYGF